MRTPPWNRSIIAIAAALGALGAACGGSSGPEATFTVVPGAQPLEALPWPSDLLRDDAGHVAVASLPLEDTAVRAQMIVDLNTEQDGFGVFSGAYFPVGRYDAGGKPEPLAVTEGSLTGNVHLLQLACADGTALPTDELPVYVHLRTHDKPQRIYARPERGVVLRERCTYAYVLTRAIATDQGALGPSADLAAVLDDAAPDSRLARAHDVFAPLRARLAVERPRREDVAAATVFTTHSLSADYLAARAALIAAGKPVAKVSRIYARTKTAADDGSLDELFGTPATEQPGLDNPGGIAHGGIEYVIHGTFETIDYLGAGPKNAVGIETTLTGFVEREGGKPKARGTISVPFTIVLPKGGDLTKMPFVVVQHGLTADRGSVISIGATLAARNIASIMVELPFHGGRAAGATDAVHDFTMAAGPDGYFEPNGDASLSFFSTGGNAAAGIPPLTPRAIRGHFFQSVCDILQGFRLMAEGDLSAIGAREPRLVSLKIDATREAYIGESFGSMIGTIVAAFEPRLAATALDVGGGGTIFPLLLNSARFAPAFGILLDGSLGTHSGDVDDPRDTDWGINLAEALFDGGDALAYAPYVLDAQGWASAEPDQAASALQLSAFQDELVPNPANLALARALGLQPLALGDGAPPDLAGWPGAEPAQGSLMGNHAGRTAAFVQFQTASHNMIAQRTGGRDYDLSSGYDHSGLDSLGFPKRPTPITFANPIDRVHGLVAAFVEAALKGEAPKVE